MKNEKVNDNKGLRDGEQMRRDVKAKSTKAYRKNNRKGEISET